MNEVREKIRALIRTSAAMGEDIAIDLIVDAVLRGTGKLGGRPRKTGVFVKPVSNPLETGYEPVTNPLVTPYEPVSNPFSDPIDTAPGPLNTYSDQSKRSDPENKNVSLTGNARVFGSGTQGPKPKKLKPAPDYSPDFERIWVETGRSGNKLPAFEAWLSVGSPSPDAVIAGWQHAERHDKRWPAYIPHLSSWLNVRGWEDRPNDRGATRPPHVGLTSAQIEAKEAEERERRRLKAQLEAENAEEMRRIMAGG